ncbi:MAG: hypothetical protein WCM76_04075 [Bacteroidota bacterium]
MKFFQIDGFSPRAVSVVFLIKVIAGVVLYIIYSHYYTDRNTADIFKYFDDSKVMYDTLFTKPRDFFQMITGIGNDTPYFNQYYHQMNNWFRVFESNIYNDSHTIIRVNALMRVFSLGYYNVHTVFMCFLSLTGLVALYKFFVPFMRDRRRELFFAVFLLPSVLFWGSGVLKEGILIFGMGMLIYYTDCLVRGKERIKSFLWLFASTILLLYVKFYVVATLFPLLIAHVWCVKTSYRHALLKYGGVLLIAAVAGLNLHYLLPQFDFVTIAVQKQHDFINLANEVKSGSIIGMAPLEYSWISLLKNTPQAFFNVLFRPFIFESGSPLFLLAGAENIMIIFIAVVCLIYANFRPVNKGILSFALIFALFTLALTGLITPVIGAIVRYKVPALPFLIIALFLIFDKERFLRRFPFFERFLRDDGE